LFVSSSEDGGASWGRYRRTGLWGYPADLVTLGDGRLLAAYGHRRDPIGIKVAVSDDGLEWNEENAREIYRPPNLTNDDGRPAAGLDSGYRHIGYPSAVVLDDGSVRVAFHSFDETTRKQIVLIASFEVA
ncbi:unnamed protein product, partial [marine sediment metagenome]